MTISILVCIASFAALVALLRHDRLSLGLPIAYLFGLLLIHVPGAMAHAIGGDVLRDSDMTALGIYFTAIGTVAFVVGVWASRVRAVRAPSASAPRERFWLFCLIGGWVFTYGLSSFGQIPSIGAAIEEGGAIWMLGVLLGLRAALERKQIASLAFWIGALAVYPVLMLLLGGFLSYGSAAIIVVISSLAISTRSHWRAAIGIAAVSYLGFNVFLNYFQHRDEIRSAVWGGASLTERVDVSLNALREFEWFRPSNEVQLLSLDARLNQNSFVGLAASRIADGQVDYLYGRSLWEGVISLVPRIVWPDKPVVAGPRIVSEMTGLTLSDTTSFGVGNVMEFQINFGMPGVVVGFFVLGVVLGWLDRKAAIAERGGDFGVLLLVFLPAVAAIRPNGSMVEIVGGPAAAIVAAHVWKRLWHHWSARRSMAARSARPLVQSRKATRVGARAV